MKPFDSIFTTNADGKTSVQSWAFTVIFLIALVLAVVMLINVLTSPIVPSVVCAPQLQPAISLQLEAPSRVMVFTDANGLHAVHIIQRPTSPTSPTSPTTSCMTSPAGCAKPQQQPTPPSAPPRPVTR